MVQLLLIAAGGALGAVGRHAVGVAALRLFGPDFPWGTLIVNVTGGLAMGLIMGGLTRFEPAHATEWRLFLATGVLGGFTTFSAFSLETVRLIEAKQVLLAALYAGGSVAFSVAGVFAGLALVRLSG